MLVNTSKFLPNTIHNLTTIKRISFPNIFTFLQMVSWHLIVFEIKKHYSKVPKIQFFSLGMPWLLIKGTQENQGTIRKIKEYCYYFFFFAWCISKISIQILHIWCWIIMTQEIISHLQNTNTSRKSKTSIHITRWHSFWYLPQALRSRPLR